MAERAVESLNRREQHRGPQREVNAEQASSDYQPKGDWDGRAAHITAKATDRFRAFGEGSGRPRGTGGGTW